MAVPAVGLPEARTDAGGARPARAASIRPGWTATVAEFNTARRRRRGSGVRSRPLGVQPGVGRPEHSPNPSLAPLEKGPFYAIKVLPGSFGTFAGLKADASSRVLTADGQPVPGLYVAGSDQANVMGGHYPSGGINIGPAMTFGYIAGRQAPASSYENVVPTLQADGV